jgi:hypothetical protein
VIDLLWDSVPFTINTGSLGRVENGTAWTVVFTSPAGDETNLREVTETMSRCSHGGVFMAGCAGIGFPAAGTGLA